MTYEATRRAPTPPQPSGHLIAILFTAAFATACILKLTGVVSWPWAVILAPIWLPWACAIVFAVTALVLAVRK
ncbi:hypothetical protein [Rhodanobacter lindaniclasticus]|uniref:Transmembrane protein n=1 Tax=Rhodanobacter lindaniclasticus TaxID=75310 RepID=A0A4S3KCK1_9GAMM|nr:hypothetical protein [Rhodanobacter lindaniclasticus]THD06130.1 hypothetical protein B1991_14400 [Rhodanobacter lindaniclasticus]